ncbi:MAG: hypothetical protein WAW11_02245 [Patescibacteria group bacterium]
MDIQAGLKEFWRSRGDEALNLLSLKKKQLECYIEHGVGKNPFLFFRLARLLTEHGLTIDKFSDLPEANRHAIGLIIDGHLTVDDYMVQTGWSRDTVLRYLKMAPGSSSRGPRDIEKASAVLMERKLGQTSDQSTEKPALKNEFSGKREVVVINHTLVTNLILAISANCVALEEILSNFLAESSESDRVYLRDALEMKGFSIFTSSNSVFRLSQKLNALCSEKALESYKK